MHSFSQPPVISRSRIYGVFAEGFVGDKAERLTFEHGVDSFGFLVAPEEEITGAQWMQRIARTYDEKNPRTAEVLRAISRVMLCDEFADDQLVLDGDGNAVCRGTSAGAAAFIAQASAAEEVAPKQYSIKPVAISSSQEVLQARVSMAKRDAQLLGGDLVEVGVGDGGEASVDFYSIPGFKLVAGSPDSLASRMLRLLSHRPVGPETFDAAENEDYEAQCALAARLVAHQGFEALVTTKPDGLEPASGPARDAAIPIDAAEFGVSLGSFASGLSMRGWTPDQPVFLCRPAPVKGVWQMAPFESGVHQMLIGFRLPKAMVATAMERHGEMQQQPLRMR